MKQEGYWRNKPVTVEYGTAVVADLGRFPLYWARDTDLIGQRVPVARVDLTPTQFPGGTSYLYDGDGRARKKLSQPGNPLIPHWHVEVEPGSFTPEVPA